MKRTKLRKYYFEALTYRADVPNVFVEGSIKRIEKVTITESSELKARRNLLETAWCQGIGVLEIQLVKSKAVN